MKYVVVNSVLSYFECHETYLLGGSHESSFTRCFYESTIDDCLSDTRMIVQRSS